MIKYSNLGLSLTVWSENESNQALCSLFYNLSVLLRAPQVAWGNPPLNHFQIAFHIYN